LKFLKRFDKVAHWCEVVGLTSNDLETQIKCFNEEVDEYMSASSHEEEMDAVADIMFVYLVLKYLDGDVATLKGIDNDGLDIIKGRADQEEALLWLDAVINSNFTKFSSTMTEKLITEADYQKKGVAVVSEKRDDLYVVRSAKDQFMGKKYIPANKILKSVAYKGPDFFLK
jgi:hypothetical protein